MTQALHTPPVCEKHGCEKRWIKNRSRKVGGLWGCPACRKENRKKWRLANPEKVIASRRLYNQVHRDKVYEQNKRWKQDNPKKVAAAQRDWQQKHLKKKAEHTRAWAKSNPQQVRAQSALRRARKLAATAPGQPVTSAAIAERLALFDGCAYCGADDKKLTVDHFIALTDGGLHVASNLVGACGCCNSSKNDKPVEEWFRSQPFFSVERWEQLNGLTCA